MSQRRDCLNCKRWKILTFNFQGLSGLGMLIGTCGLGLVVARNLVERGQEIALFEALGFS